MRTKSKAKASTCASKKSRNDKNKKQKNRLQLKVGKRWTEEAKITVEHRDSILRSTIAFILAVCLAIQLLALTIYGMVAGNAAALEHAVTINRLGLSAVGVWIMGKAAFNIFGGKGL